MTEKNDNDNDMLIGLNRAMFEMQEAAFEARTKSKDWELPKEKFERKKRREKTKHEKEQERILSEWEKEQEKEKPMTKERLHDWIVEEISYKSDTGKLKTYISEAVNGKPENLRTMVEEGHLNPLEISGVFSEINRIKKQ